MEQLILKDEQFAKESEIENHAKQILENLGLTVDNLKEKEVLALGACGAELGIYAKKQGADVISFDRRRLENKPENIHYVVGDYRNSPFPAESFDLIVSHAAPPTIMVNNIDDVRACISEAKRTLKEGGEFRFGPIEPMGISAYVYGSEKIFTDEENKTFTDDERFKRLKEKSLELLQSIDPSIKEDKSTPEGYYILRKSQETEGNELGLEIEKAIDPIYAEVANEKDIPAEEVHYSRNCEFVTDKLYEQLKGREDLKVTLMGYQGWDITHHQYLIINESIVDPTWQQFLDEPDSSKPKVLVCKVAELDQKLNEYGISKFKHIYDNSIELNPQRES